jgi:hypothetical protein
MAFYTPRRLIPAFLFTSRSGRAFLIGLIFVAIFAGVFWTSGRGQEFSTNLETVPDVPELESFSLSARVPISPKYYAHNVIVSRSVIDCPAGECVVEHRLQEWTRIDPLSTYVRDEYAELVFEPGNPWYRGQDAGRCSATFNCATFAVANYVHLTSNEWLSTTPTSDGYPTPIAIIIDSYFTPICEWSVAQAIDNKEFETDERLQNGDVLAFESSSSESDRTRRIFTHLGLVKRQDGLNRLLSKFGEGPILLSDLKFPDRMFPGAQKITIYRFRGDRP